MSTDPDLDDTLIDMFRSEVETHSEVLSSALLALERAPRDTSRIDEMMRAAHSIKGAARVVGVDPAVSVAHVMEDCFVEAQKGAISFSSGDVDVLLRGVDLLVKISNATRNPNADLTREFSELVQSRVLEIQGVLSGTGKSGQVSIPGDSTSLAASNATGAPKLEAVALSTPASSPSAASLVTISFPEILDAVAAEQIRGQFLSAIDSQCANIQFDLRATRDLDVQGLAFLAAVPRHLAQQGRPLVELAGVSTEMATVLRVTGLGNSFGIHRVVTRETE